ncbi:unnamed protein product, partial [Brenthis ino]
MSSDDRRKKIREDCEESIGAYSPNDTSEENNVKEKRRKFQNKIRCQRYRHKKKIMNATVNLQISNPQTITVEEKEKIKRRKERYKEASQRYRDRKRMNLMNLRVDQCSGIIVKHASECQNFHTSQIAGPSTRDVPYVPPTQTAGLSTWNELYISESHSYSDDEIHNEMPLEVEINDEPQINSPIITNDESNTRNIHPNHVQNNMQSMVFQHHLPVQTYSSFVQDSRAHMEFQKKFIDNDFGHVCDICDRLWFKNDLKFFLNNDATPCIEFIRTMLPNSNLAEVKICSTCFRTIKINRVPPLSVYNGFKYPPFPENLKKNPLNLVTERLISPRIPFMQIRHDLGEFGIYEQVINVPIEVNTMVRALPRSVDDDHNIMVHIKRKKIHKSSYVYGIVNKRKIKAWLQYLKDTPLYTFYGITVDDSFLNGQDDIKGEITYDEDGDNDILERIPFDESFMAQQQTLMWNDEMYLRIASGEDNVPNSLLFDEHEEELSFPQIYLGQFRTFREGLIVTPFMMATSELRRSDRRGVTPQHLLYLAMKIMRIRIRDSLSIAFKRVGKDASITKQQIESENYIYGYIESKLAFLRTIPNSAYYWSEKKKDLFAMIRQYVLGLGR